MIKNKGRKETDQNSNIYVHVTEALSNAEILFFPTMLLFKVKLPKIVINKMTDF